MLSATPLFAVSDNINVQADSFMLDADRQQVDAIGHVVVTYDDIILRGDRATFDKNRQIVRVQGNVKITKEKMVISCYGAVAYKSQGRVDGFGNVKFLYNDMNGRSDRASYFIGSKQVILASNALITRRDNSISGDRVSIDLLRNRFKTVGSSELILSISELQAL